MPFLRGLAGPKYNILKVAGSSLGYKHLPEIRIRINEALSGDKSPLFGKIYPPEMRAKMSEALTGKIATQLTKEKMSEAHTGKNLSEETKLKISEALTGKVLTEATKAKISEANIGKILSEGTKEKISITRGTCIYVYNCDKSLINYIFNSYRKAAEFLR